MRRLRAQLDNVRLAAETVASGQFRPVSGLRVLYVTEMVDAPFRYRVQNAVEQLRQSGAHARILSPSNCPPHILESYHVVVFYRQKYSEQIALLIDAARRFGTTAVFDCDDLIFFDGAERQLPFLKELSDLDYCAYSNNACSMEQTVKECQFFLASTQTIAEKASELGLPGLVHRNLLSTFQEKQGSWLNRFKAWSRTPPLVGFFSGSNTHDVDFQLVQEALTTTFERERDVKLLVVGHLRCDSFVQRFPGRVLRVPYISWREYPAMMARCRVVLAPIAEISSFTDAKSALKFFEAGILGVPIIASPIAEMRMAIGDGNNGWLATYPNDWLERLAAALDLRNSERVGTAARESVLAHHTTHSQKGVLAALLSGTVTELGRRPRRQLDADALSEINCDVETRGDRLKRVRRSIVYLSKPPEVWAQLQTSRAELSQTTDPSKHATLDLLYSASGPKKPVLNDAAKQSLCLPASDLSKWERLTIEIKASSAEKFPRLNMYFEKKGDTNFLDTPALSLPVRGDGKYHAFEIHLNALPRAAQPAWQHAGELQQVMLKMVPECSFDIRMLVFHNANTHMLARATVAFIRENLASRFLQGDGIEIGALQNPLSVPAKAKVQYVDVLTKQDALKHYPELPADLLVEPTIIDNAQSLATVPDESLDFCIGNHVLEHTRNPMSALRNWLRVLKPGGVAYVAIPDRTNKLDHRRPVTKLEHILLDDLPLDRAEHNHIHYLEWAIYCNSRPPGAEADARAAELEALGYNIHFHVFDKSLFKNMLELACREAPAEIVEMLEHNDQGAVEQICILRKLPKISELRRPVCIVVPIYNAYDQVVCTCESVLRHAQGDWTLIAVDDCSPDPRIQKYLKELAAREPRVQVLTNKVNAGFVITANAGIKASAAGSDILLLNSDVQVTEHFLRRLQDAAMSRKECGIVTPFSNNATIFSIPKPGQDNPLPDGFDADALQSLVTRTSRKQRYEMPTAVGFCMYIRRDVIEKIGLLDEVSFGRGFGEENDFCERAKKSGYVIGICDDQFIYHAGKASFAAEGHALSRKNGVILERKHPGYHMSITRFVVDNPLRGAHAAINSHLKRWNYRDEPALMILLHADPLKQNAGGTEAHVLDRVAHLGFKRVILVYPGGTTAIMAAEILNGDVANPILYKFPLLNNLVARAHRHPEAEEILLWIACIFGVATVCCDHMLWFPLSVILQFKSAGIPYVCVMHDFYSVCPSLNLLNVSKMRPCEVHTTGKGDAAACLGELFKHCLETPQSDIKTLLPDHQKLFGKILSNAEKVIFPSGSTRDIVLSAHAIEPSRAIVIPHGYPTIKTAPVATPGPYLRVALIGAISDLIKGCDLIIETVERTKQPVEWHFFGRADASGFKHRIMALTDRCVFHGVYARDNIVDMLCSSGVEIALFMSVCPETFSFTLSESYIAGVPPIVPNLGALAERVKQSGLGWIIEPHSAIAASGLIEKLAQNRHMVREARAALEKFQHTTVQQNAANYRSILEPLLNRPAPVKGMPLHYLSAAMESVVSHDSTYRERYVSSPNSAESLISHIKPMHHVKIIKGADAHILRSSGDDPHVLLNIPLTDSPILRIDVDSPSTTTLQMFYTTPEKSEFAEDRSIRHMLQKGRNEVYLGIPGVVASLRMDPGETSGDYVFHTLEIKAE